MELNRYIEHTLLKPEATAAQIKALCAEAVKYNFASVCVNSAYIPLVVDELAASNVAPCCVVGFPLGAALSQAKAAEAEYAVTAGAKEIDMVINIGLVKDGDWHGAEADIRAVANVCHPRAILKVIIECCLLTQAEKVEACHCARRAGADYVKTSTGFSTGGATISDVRLMRKTVGDTMGVKAAGGIRTIQDAIAMIQAGANRLGTSAGVKLVEGE